jgi:hypothetical protein
MLTQPVFVVDVGEDKQAGGEFVILAKSIIY